ncbi:hypothetical protein Mbo2_095 [Rhodococcus phage Mbo2]|uniref:Uncharacterized protein n=1 Tax=Rhodococcus phage Mbo2 TaxID=2936911 RepID=A0A9E7IFQ5_9CAUD|nr:hypothetical protein Mbo2_095 [Rhodococcus phage Mbo2]
MSTWTTHRTAEGIRQIPSNGDAAAAIDARQDFRTRAGNFTGQLLDTATVVDARPVLGGGPGIRGHVAGRPETDIRILSTGELPAAWAERLAADITEHGRVFVVRSYLTVIAWTVAPPVEPGRTDAAEAGRVILPNVRYSPTTDRHQWAVAEARGARWESLPGVQAATVPHRPAH